MIELFDENHDGNIDFVEFVRLMEVSFWLTPLLFLLPSDLYECTKEMRVCPKQTLKFILTKSSVSYPICVLLRLSSHKLRLVKPEILERRFELQVDASIIGSPCICTCTHVQRKQAKVPQYHANV
ncbi:hypothetical protein BHE74_00033892 [Ensete ventricosum]|nr:hypothetical protein GW17_00028129 [Ensete ventricosum]RWW59190.1 hypothetical protein BHE74_00033892 [Ensete ventricosum]RZS11092.1 hypothetical protein BHM03_00042382 [Ensete ventricosum]